MKPYNTPIEKVEPLFECNGMCGINDLNAPNKTQKSINYEILFE